MPANHKVSIAWQIVFTFLPIVNFWAFYRIRKLQRYLLYIFVPEIIITTIYVSYLYGALLSTIVTSPTADVSESFMAYDKDPTLEILTQVASWGFQGFAIYLVIIWSRKHNRQFDQPLAQDEPPK
jgi:hypothetical protein